MSHFINTIVIATQMLLGLFTTRDTEGWKALNYAIEILNKAKNDIVAYGGRLWVYHEGVYVTFTSKEQTLHFVKQAIASIDGTSHVASKKIQAVLQELFTQYHELSPHHSADVTYVNMKSNVLAIHKDGKIETVPHDPKYNFTYKLPYDYHAQVLFLTNFDPLF